MPSKTNLGKSLIRQKQRNDRTHKSNIHSIGVEGADWSKLPVRSITEETTLNSFFNIAQLADTDFSALKKNLKMIDKSELEGVLICKRKMELDELHRQLEDCLKIPRRPAWTKEMSADELHRLESATFLEWRAKIAEISERDDLVITPFEKNLDFWRELWRVVERSNVLVQIVDARRPMLFYSKDLDAYVKEHKPEKNTVLLMNKSDLLSKCQRKVWAEYFQSLGLNFIFWSALNATDEREDQSEDEEDDEDDDNSSVSTLGPDQEEDESCKILSVQELLDKLRSLDPNGGKPTEDGKTFTVGFIGYPNVGKSSTLNAIIGAKKVSVSSTPGHTKRLQTIFLNQDFMLCDCPGLVLPSFAYTRSDLVTSGILSVDENRDYVGPINILCNQIPRHVLESVYGVNIKKPPSHEDQNRVPTAYEFLGAFAYMRGFMTSKGVPNFDRAARIALKDYVNGKLLYCYGPPTMDAQEFIRLSDLAGDASFAPSCQEKLVSHATKPDEANASDDEPEEDRKLNLLMTDLKDLQLSLNPMKNHSSGAYRTKRHIPDSSGILDDRSERANDDTESTSSWATVSSQATSSIGGKSLLSGVGNSAHKSVLSRTGEDFDSVTAKQAWRRCSEAKRDYYPIGQDAQSRGTARPRKKKEKLRKVYADLDKTEAY